MDGINVLKAIILGIVEGLTEFLPISSTGHLILTADLLSANGDKAKLFEVFIQLGAILAVVWIYRKKIFSVLSGLPKNNLSKRFAINIIIAFIPAAFVGLATHKFIKEFLFSTITVSIALVIGGIIIFLIEKQKHKNILNDIEQITYTAALFVGISQIASLIPGISRSAATIMGGILSGMTRKTATEFSFFLAIPTMFAATLFDLYKSASVLSGSDISILSIGFITSYISAVFVIRWFLKFISTHDFKFFAYYRIVFGSVLLLIYLL